VGSDVKKPIAAPIVGGMITSNVGHTAVPTIREAGSFSNQPLFDFLEMLILF
jgi:hypothetical protein